MSERKIKTIDFSSMKKKKYLKKYPSKDSTNRELKFGKNSLYFSSEEQIQKELDDPNNEIIKDSLSNIITLRRSIQNLTQAYEKLKENKVKDHKEVEQKTSEINNNISIHYKYIPYFKGLQPLIEDFLAKKLKHYQEVKNKANIFSEKNSNFFEQLYQTVGHDIYTKILKLFESYCLFGKSYTNFTMEYSQFCSLFLQNKLYDFTMSKSDLEVIYNRIKKKTIDKNVTFIEFLYILNEISKHLYKWETNDLFRIRYLINNHFSNLPCLTKSLQEKKFDRWYFLLESESIKNIVKEYLPFLFDWFYKNADSFKYILDIENFMKMIQEKRIVPVFLSNKEVMGIFNFVKYQKKNLYPANSFDFITFVETICIISLLSSDKYIEEGGKMQNQLPNENDNEIKKENNPPQLKISKQVEVNERLRIFLNFLIQK